MENYGGSCGSGDMNKAWTPQGPPPNARLLAKNMTPGPTVATPTLVRDQITRIEEIVQHLHGSISGVTQHLETMLAPVPPSAEAAGRPDRPIVSSVTERLSLIAEALQAAIRRLGDLDSRIEL